MTSEKRKIIVATRKSELALTQSRQFLAQLVAVHPHVEIEELHVVTTGDKIVDRPLSEIGGKGLFLKEIEEALLDGSADIAVHSLKDVPPELHPGLEIACIPEREDPRDALISRDGRGFDELPEGSRLGTSSLRRGVQLKALRPDLIVLPLRGNVGTRIRKCRDGEVDATVLAHAGLRRLGLENEIAELLSTERSLPAVGQGALAIEIRSNDDELRRLLAPLNHDDTLWAVTTERGVMTAVEGDCKTPVAAHAERDGEEMRLRGFLASPDGDVVVRRERRAAWPTTLDVAFQLGLELGRELVAARAR